MELLRTQPDAVEVCVEAVNFQRRAEAEGRYDDVLTMLNGLR